MVRRWDKVVPSPGRRRVLFSAKIQHCFFLIPSFNFFISLQESWAAPNTSRDALGKPSCRFPGHAFIPPHCHPPAHLPATSTTPSGFEKPKAKWRFLLWSLLLGDSSSSTVWLAAWADPPPPGLEQLPAGNCTTSEGLSAASHPTPSFSQLLQLTPAEPHSLPGRSPGASPHVLLPGKGADPPRWLMDAPPHPPPHLPLLPMHAPCPPFLSHPEIPATAIPTLDQLPNSNVRGLKDDPCLSRTAGLAGWHRDKIPLKADGELDLG